MSSTLCLANLLESTNCDIAIISEHKLKPNLLPYMNSIDMRYKSVSKTEKLNDLCNCTHGKGGISILYKASLQFSIEEITETNSDRIVDICIRRQNNDIENHNWNAYKYDEEKFRAICIIHTQKPYECRREKSSKERCKMEDGRPRGMQHESYFNSKRAKPDFTNIQKLANEQFIEETYDDINNAAECDIRLFWKLIKRQKPKHSKVCQQIIHNNIVHTSPESICNAFANYFEDLYTPADTLTFDDPTLNEMNKAYREIERVCKADEDLYLPGGLISCDDVSSVIKQLKHRKACGNDMIQNEHLIYG
ncbi:unnamed protein product [Mytilus coruscus]|uniref:Uncharacterized protein n=1 Tax=Mytilus coruscus TaxID=42192 RepID=A0A6J8CV92_MYTCO|nr:unnamed protein product [Mytilus coruscus]